ncbi:hypothetical protein NC651_017077 [Populus alba x Populus x berolinensis]|nr:hypothetical protein NC651_017077 [Populus alba x Populus x berolinensis]
MIVSCMLILCRYHHHGPSHEPKAWCFFGDQTSTLEHVEKTSNQTEYSHKKTIELAIGSSLRNRTCDMTPFVFLI